MFDDVTTGNDPVENQKAVQRIDSDRLDTLEIRFAVMAGTILNLEEQIRKLKERVFPAPSSYPSPYDASVGWATRKNKKKAY